MSVKSLAIVGDTVTGICPLPHDDGNGGTLYDKPFTGTWGSLPIPYRNVVYGVPPGINIILVGDPGSASCGHTFFALTGAANSGINGQFVHRTGDDIGIVEKDNITIVGQTVSPGIQSNCTSI